MAGGGRWCLAPFPPNLFGLRMCSDLGTQWNWHYVRSTPRLQEAFQFLFLLLWEPWQATCDQNQGALPGSEKHSLTPILTAGQQPVFWVRSSTSTRPYPPLPADYRHASRPQERQWAQLRQDERLSMAVSSIKRWWFRDILFQDVCCLLHSRR